jgi:hypothetical protein
MFHEEKNDFVVRIATETVPEIRDSYLREEIQETDPSEVSGNIDEPALFAIMDD